MRQVLTAKLRKSGELKRKLGITAWGEFQSDLTQGLRNVKETSTLVFYPFHITFYLVSFFLAP